MTIVRLIWFCWRSGHKHKGKVQTAFTVKPIMSTSENCSDGWFIPVLLEVAVTLSKLVLFLSEYQPVRSSGNCITLSSKIGGNCDKDKNINTLSCVAFYKESNDLWNNFPQKPYYVDYPIFVKHKGFSLPFYCWFVPSLKKDKYWWIQPIPPPLF